MPVSHTSAENAHKRITSILFAISLLTAGYAHKFVEPYSPAAPKRVVLNHIIFTEAVPTAFTADVLAAGGQQAHDRVVMRAVNESIALGGVDSTPLEVCVVLYVFCCCLR